MRTNTAIVITSAPTSGISSSATTTAAGFIQRSAICHPRSLNKQRPPAEFTVRP